MSNRNNQTNKAASISLGASTTKKSNSSTNKAQEEYPIPPGPKTFLEWYLLSYNQVSILGWFFVGYLAVNQLYNTGGDFSKVFEMVWPALSMVQTFAICEVVHSLFGWVRAPFLTTAMQVASRLLLVWGVNYLVPQVNTHWSFSTMVIAWSVAECVRYLFYTFHLSSGGSGVPSGISWARYNFFLVLYPLGVISELMMVYQALPFAKEMDPLYYYALIVAALVYIPGFPMLFSHMLVQRRKYMKGGLKKKEN